MTADELKFWRTVASAGEPPSTVTTLSSDVVKELRLARIWDAG